MGSCTLGKCQKRHDFAKIRLGCGSRLRASRRRERSERNVGSANEASGVTEPRSKKLEARVALATKTVTTRDARRHTDTPRYAEVSGASAIEQIATCHYQRCVWSR